MDEKELLQQFFDELAKASDALRKQVAFWRNTLIVSNVLWFILVLTLISYIFLYLYNTEFIVETITQDGVLNNAVENNTNTTISNYYKGANQ